MNVITVHRMVAFVEVTGSLQVRKHMDIGRFNLPTQEHQPSLGSSVGLSDIIGNKKKPWRMSDLILMLTRITLS